MPSSEPESTPETQGERYAPPRPKAPDSPRIKAWNRRIMGWGCLPVMVAGLVAAFQVPYAVEIGTALALVLGVPITAYALWLRWRNRQAFAAALAAAEATGGRVKTTVDARGDHVYEVRERPVEAPLDLDALGPD